MSNLHDAQIAIFETALRSLAPARFSADRDRLMYDAGFASGKVIAARRSWIWLALTVTSTAAAAVLAIVLATREDANVNLPDGGHVAARSESGTIDVGKNTDVERFENGIGASGAISDPTSFWRMRQLAFDERWDHLAVPQKLDLAPQPNASRPAILRRLMGM